MASAPQLSVIVPTLRRRTVLARCLDALAAQSLDPSRFEIVVSDNGSEPSVEALCTRFGRERDIRVHYVPQSNPHAPSRNAAIEKARGDHLVFINDDTFAVPEMLAEHLRSHREHGPRAGLAVLGRVTIDPELPPSLFAALHLDASYDALRGRTELEWRNLYTCNVSIRRDFLLEGELFDETLGFCEDTELAERLSPRGLRVVYNPRALCYHHHELDEGDYLRMAAREGTALARWYAKAPEKARVLGSVGFYPGLPRHRRLRYALADAALGPLGRRAALGAARRLAAGRGRAASWIYRKLYQAMKREAIRAELRRLGA